ncbi:MAG: hypothetical protein WCA12_10635, partial [Burkholderiales bacterium]
FVAGVGKMSYVRFLSFSVAGALLWVISLVYLGYFFGNIPIIKNNLTVVIFAIIGISLAPIAMQWLKHRRVPARG